MRDQDERQAELALQVAQQVQDLRLDRDVERRDRLVGDDQLRLAARARARRRCAGAGRPRTRAGSGCSARGSGPTCSISSCTARLRSPSPLFEAVDRERLGDDRADRLARVQRRVGVLEDHLHLAPQRLQLRARERARCPGRRSVIVPLVGSSRRIIRRAVVRLAAAGLADDPERLAAHARRTTRRRPRARRRPGCWKTIPRVIGKCLTRSRTSTSALAHAGSSSSRRRGRARLRGQLARAQLAPTAACASRLAAGRRRGARARPGTGSSCGSTRRWRSRTYGQRGWNEQPLGSVIRLGGRPGIGTSGSSRGRSRRGIERSRPHV